MTLVMSTKPLPHPPAETSKRQTRYLVGAAVIVGAAVVGSLVMDAVGSSRDENRTRTNESREQAPVDVRPE